MTQQPLRRTAARQTRRRALRDDTPATATATVALRATLAHLTHGRHY